MAYTRTQARNLLTATELTLFDAGRTADVKALTATQLKSKVERTRKLRDKYRDLFKRQRLAARDRTGSKGGRSGVANARSKEKGVLFNELLGRFQARLAVVEAAAKKAAKPAAKKAKVAKKASKTTKAKVATKATKKGAKKDAKKGAKKAGKSIGAKKAASKKPATKKAPAKKASVKKASAKKAPAKKKVTSSTSTSAKSAKPAPAGQRKPGSKAPRARKSLADVTGAEVSPIQGGYVSSKAKNVAMERHMAESRTRPIQAHISSAGRRNQARRDKRGS